VPARRDDRAMPDDPGYSLALSPVEVERYRFMAATARATEGDLWTRAGIVEGARVGDIGCGPGLVLLELADVVGAGGHVRGVDRDADAVRTAAGLIADAGLAHAAATTGDAWATGIEPGTLDVVNIRHVLAHNTAEHRRAILAHALDLLRPGGHLYLVDVDLGAASMDPHDEDIADLLGRYVAHLADTSRAPRIGPTLGSAIRGAGFELIERAATMIVLPSVALASIRPPAWAARDAMVASGHADAADVVRWDAALSAMASRALDEQATVFNPVFTVVGRKPGVGAGA
jgi:SAM-dependent methyltransferase